MSAPAIHHAPNPAEAWPPHQVSVVASRTSEGRNPHTLYVVIVQYNATTQWTIDRRFSDFEQLRLHLSEFLPPTHLPLLPAKTFTRSLDPHFVSWRRKELDSWMRVVMQSEFVRRSGAFAAFLEAPKHVGEHELRRWAPVELKGMVDPHFGITDCWYERREELMFTACEDIHVLSRIERKLSNMRLPWEQQGQQMRAAKQSDWVHDAHNAACPWRTADTEVVCAWLVYL